MQDAANPSFERLGPLRAALPVVIAVAHAGRTYPDPMAALVRVPTRQLLPLEDRYADRLAERAAEAGVPVVVQRTARAWIDCNRAERDLDPAMIDPAQPPNGTPLSSRVRGGLGLVPRRLAGVGDLWRTRLAAQDVARRIVDHHRPFHDAVAQALEASRRRFGVAVLVDLHSMPPLKRGAAGPSPVIVVGDRHGTSAAAGIVRRALAIATGAGYAAAANDPYAGGYTIERHGAPARDVHAIQIEVDRRLYLDPTLSAPGPGLPTMQALVNQLAQALAAEALSTGLAEAAE